ncbi:MAG: hypothetical protein ACHQ53_00095 [Polyangiales bacterium]
MLGSEPRRRAALPLAIYALSAAAYVATLGSRIRGISDNAHFVYLAQSLLHGKLSLLTAKPPGDNDWAIYHGHWYVSFPPFPAVVIAPLVALFGTATWDRLFWALLAGLSPALLYVLLRRLRELGQSGRSVREDLLLVALFAFGSPFYYTAVQGTVWFAAHVVACPLIALYLLWALDARRPLLAGGALALAFMTRPTTLLLGAFFLLETLRVTRSEGEPQPSMAGLLRVKGLDLRAAARKLVLFALPLVLVLGIAMWMNAARFDDSFEFGHSYLNIRWRPRIDTWGLVNYHYLGRNLAVFLTALPWLSAHAPYLKLSRHGLALWVTTPQLVLVLWPRRATLTMTALALSAGAVALLDLLYQNSGWIQFGYRFSLDYAMALFALLALGGRRFGKLFFALSLWALAVNAFGAITFDRDDRFYDGDTTQQVIFQPD